MDYILKLANRDPLLTNMKCSLAPLITLRRATWLAILPIALLQLTIATHQFDHVADYDEGTCNVCAQLDRIDTAVDHSAESVSLPPNDIVRAATPVDSTAGNRARNYDSRAPPKV